MNTNIIVRSRYDISLKPKDENKKLLNKNDLRRASDKFIISDIQSDSDDNAVAFTAKFKDYQPEWVGEGFNFSSDGKEPYWVSASSSDDKFLNYFFVLINDLSKALKLSIYDPDLDSDSITGLLGDDTLSPQERIETEGTSGEDLWYAKQSFNSKAYSTYFTKYLITSVDPMTKKNLLLTMGDGIYCSKVNEGEVLKDVIDKEIVLLTGSHEYTPIRTGDDGTALDRHGKELTRIFLSISIPYFDPNERKTEVKAIWQELPDTN